MNYRHEVFVPASEAELEGWVRGGKVSGGEGGRANATLFRV